MKKTLFLFSMSMAILFCCAMAVPDSRYRTELVEPDGNYHISVHVSYSDGGSYRGAKVQGEVCGILGGMTKSVRTDSRGYAKLTFTSNESLCKIFINGKTKRGKWENGTTAYFID